MPRIIHVTEENSVSGAYSILDLNNFDTIGKLPEAIAIDEFKDDSCIWD